MLVLNSNMENGTLTVSLRIEPGEFMDALNEAYAEHTDTYPVPGHASGLAPREEIEKLYGETALFDEALDICVPRLYARYLKENAIRTVGRPQLTEVTWLHGGGAKFTVVCDVYPKVKLGQYKGLTVDTTVNQGVFGLSPNSAANFPPQATTGTMKTKIVLTG